MRLFILYYSFFVFFIFLIQPHVLAQKHKEPINFSTNDLLSVKRLNIDSGDAEKVNIRTEDEPMFAGRTIRVNVNTNDSASWSDRSAEGKRIWLYLIENPAGKPLVFYFDTLVLAPQSTLFLIDLQSDVVVAAVSRLEKQVSTIQVLGPYKSSSILIQLETALNADDDHIVMSEIGLLDANFGERGFGTSDYCEVNVNCPEGNSYKKEKQGVARILVKQGSGLFYCTGSLINNTRRDLMPLFLTANHCGRTATAADYERWVFYFNYESQSCENPATEPEAYTLTGATLLASAGNETADGSDFKLVKLLQEVPAQINPYFNGWNRLGITTSGVSIHHPDGDIKKISSFTEKPLSTSYGGGTESPDEKYWRVTWAATTTAHGVTEGGSSGSPLFDADGYIVGALTGGLATCDNANAPDYYGKIGYSWTSNGTTPEFQLQPWLDPLNSGIEKLGGMGYNMEVLNADFEADHTEIIIGQSISFNNRSTGDINGFEWFFEAASEPNSTDESPSSVLYESLGNFDVRLVVSNGITSDTLLKKDYISVMPSVYPNPSDGAYTIDFGKIIPEIVSVEVFDVVGHSVPFTASQQNNQLMLKVETIRNGIFFVKYVDLSTQRVLKIIKQ